MTLRISSSNSILFGNFLACWAWLGGQIHGGRNARELRLLDFRTDGCVNATIPTSAPSSGVMIDHSKGVQEMYHVSYFYLGVIGSWSTFVVGFLVAILKRAMGKGGKRPDERTLHRWFRKYDPYSVKTNGVSNEALDALDHSK